MEIIIIMTPNTNTTILSTASESISIIRVLHRHHSGVDAVIEGEDALFIKEQVKIENTEVESIPTVHKAISPLIPPVM